MAKRATTRKTAKTTASPLPKFVDPQLCTLVETAPSGPDWVHEPKLDGYRIAARITAGKVQLLTRSGIDWTHRYPATVAAFKKLKLKSAYIDGELCGVDADGIPSFVLTQQASDGEKDIALTYYGFDLLHLNGRKIASLPLIERKALLQPLIDGKDGFQFVSHIEADGEAFRAQACKMGLEGIVSKKIDASYAPDNRGIWVKAKCRPRQEFVIIGWTNSDTGGVFGALLLGYYDEDGKLAYAGRCGSGFTNKLAADLLRKLRPLETAKMPIPAFPKSLTEKGLSDLNRL
jgi:DNA ligase D-like protein (predicted ligase)